MCLWWPRLCFLSERERQILYWLRLGLSNGSPSTPTRKFTRRSMPRTAGLSGSSRVWFMRRKPSDSTVALISVLAPIWLFIRVALMVLSATSPSRGWRRHTGALSAAPTLWGGLGIGGGQALADHLLHVLAAQLGHLLGRLQLLERGQRRANRVDRVVGAVRLGEDVLDAGRLDDRTHRAARDDPGARSGRLEHDAGRAPLEAHLMRDGRADHRHGDHVALRDLHALTDGLGHLARLADAGADAAIHVTDHDQRAEGELAAALDDLGDAVDADDAVRELGPFARRVPATAHVS